jgi:hypothetical protein
LQGGEHVLDQRQRVAAHQRASVGGFKFQDGQYRRRRGAWGQAANVRCAI